MKVKKTDQLWIIFFVLIFILAMAVINVMERWNDMAIKSINIENKVKSNEYQFNIDKIEFVDGDIILDLWYLNNTKPMSIEQYVVLENTRTKESFIVPTMMYQRQDIVDYYGETAYLLCGMQARLADKYIDSNVDYRVYVLIKNDGQNKIISLDTTVKGWKKNEG